ncbi:MAG: hypothetical protein GMKNLPBB_02380 [Myxococcota bacterium]|nr:hypothetical protein [Myxococcota bacterium]
MIIFLAAFIQPSSPATPDPVQDDPVAWFARPGAGKDNMLRPLTPRRTPFLRRSAALAAAFPLAAMWAVSAPAAAQNGEGIVLDRMAARVAGQVITVREVEAEARVLIAWEKPAKALAEPKPKILDKTLRWLTDQHLIYDQATRLKISPGSSDAVDERMKQFQGLFGGAVEYRNFLARSGLSRAELRNIISRDLTVENYSIHYLRSRLRVTREDIDEYLRRNPEAFRGNTNTQFIQKVVANRIVMERKSRAREEILSRLREKNPPEYFVDFLQRGLVRDQKETPH